MGKVVLLQDAGFTFSSEKSKKIAIFTVCEGRFFKLNLTNKFHVK